MTKIPKQTELCRVKGLHNANIILTMLDIRNVKAYKFATGSQDIGTFEYIIYTDQRMIKQEELVFKWFVAGALEALRLSS